MRPRRAETLRGSNPCLVRKIPLSTDRARLPHYRKRPGSDRNFPLGAGAKQKMRNGAARNLSQPYLSGGSPLAVLGVNLGHENGSEGELSLSGLPRQFAQIAASRLNRRTSLEQASHHYRRLYLAHH